MYLYRLVVGDLSLYFHGFNLTLTTMSFSVSNFLETFTCCPPTQRLWIAYSGGLDSHVLLHALAQLRPHLNLELRAVHIHHGLQSQADDWAKHCQQVCQALEIRCEVIRVKVRAAPRESLEANARSARYEAIAQLLAPDDVVLTAQHADDQAETLLLQLLRGAGVAGLAAMPPVCRLAKGWLVRPLLAYTRAELDDYARQANLHWIEDGSNADIRFNRNFLRHEIMPLLQQRWTSVSHILSRVARHQAEADELVQILAEEDLQTCEGLQPDQLSLAALSSLNQARQRNVLRFWLKKLGLPLPSTVQLQHIISDIVTAKEDRQPVVRWHGGEVRRYRKDLFAMPNLPPAPKVSQSQCFTWLLPQVLRLPLGELRANEVQGRGLALPAGTPLQVRFRQGGETFYWRGHQRVVKKLLQAAQLPPWHRSFIPLIYFENTLVAIPGIGICEKFVAIDGDGERGWEIQWRLDLS
jgi:tRNA(Ile)-lysidine synthase